MIVTLESVWRKKHPVRNWPYCPLPASGIHFG